MILDMFALAQFICLLGISSCMGQNGNIQQHSTFSNMLILILNMICWGRFSYISKRVIMKNSMPKVKSVCIHRSYHDGEHYNSVRLKEDTFTGPARPISIKVLQPFLKASILDTILGHLSLFMVLTAL